MYANGFPDAYYEAILRKQVEMSKYTPDCWMIAEQRYPDGEVHLRVFAGWYGSFTTGESWKLSSGITNVKKTEDMYEFTTMTGSRYFCYKSLQSISGYMSRIWSSITNEPFPDGCYIKLLENYT